jgi:signal transduction histidine kinase
VRSVFSASDRGASRRGRQYALLLGLFALVLAVVNVTGWRVYASMRGTLDAELGERLKGIATAAAASIDPGYVDEISHDPDGLEAFIVRDRFERLKSQLALANLVLLDPGGRTLADLGGAAPPGEIHPLFLLHPDAFAAAKSGISSASALMSSLDAHYKNGYAPLVAPEGVVVGVVAAEAGVGFFAPLAEIRRVVLVAGVASAAAIVFLGILFFRVLRAESRLETAMRRTESLSLMGEMAASVAHEIRNPLGIIRASAERIRTRFGTGEEIFDYIPEEVDRLDAILRAYLDFARGGGEGPGVRCDVHDVVGHALRLVRRDLEGAGIAVVEGVEPGLAAAISASALQQVLLNLILNARQAMDAGGSLTISGRGERGQVLLAVSDTGIGIAREDLVKVFQPFHSGRTTGSGLGLAISQRVVSDAGGRLVAESTPGAGSTFTITLPAAKGEA